MSDEIPHYSDYSFDDLSNGRGSLSLGEIDIAQTEGWVLGLNDTLEGLTSIISDNPVLMLGWDAIRPDFRKYLVYALVTSLSPIPEASGNETFPTLQEFGSSQLRESFLGSRRCDDNYIAYAQRIGRSIHQ